MPASSVFLTIQTDTKAEETEIVNQFLLRLGYSSEAFSLSESPDFEIGLQGNQIGVEVTKYYADFTSAGSKSQADFSEWIAFARKLKKTLKEADPTFDTIYGAVHFKPGHILYKNLLKEVCLLEFIRLFRDNPVTDEDGTSVSITNKIYPNLSTHIDSIYLRNMFPETKYLWWNSRLQSGEVMTDDAAIENIIAKKELAARKYKSGYFQKWLIIYAGGLGLHDLYLSEPPNIFRQGKIMASQINPVAITISPNNGKPSYFSHIFIWDKFTETIYLLYPYSKKIFDYGEGKIFVNHLPLK